MLSSKMAEKHRVEPVSPVASKSKSKRGCCDCSVQWEGFSDIPIPTRTVKNKCNPLFFHWYGALLRLGSKRPVMLNDFWYLPEFNQSRVIVPALEKLYHEEVAKKKKHPLLWALLRTRVCDTIAVGCYKVLIEGSLYALPMISRLLIEFAQTPEEFDDRPWYPYVVATGLALVAVWHAVGFQGYVDLTARLGMHRRVALQGMIYRKAMRVDMSKTNVGQVTNLMSNDTMKLQLGVMLVNNFYWQPVSAFICMVLLYTVLGPAALVRCCCCCCCLMILLLGEVQVLPSQCRYPMSTRSMLPS